MLATGAVLYGVLANTMRLSQTCPQRFTAGACSCGCSWSFAYRNIQGTGSCAAQNTKYKYSQPSRTSLPLVLLSTRAPAYAPPLPTLTGPCCDGNARTLTAGWLASHVRRDRILQCFGFVAYCAIAAMVLALLAPSMVPGVGDMTQYYLLCGALAVWGVAQVRVGAGRQPGHESAWRRPGMTVGL